MIKPVACTAVQELVSDAPDRRAFTPHSSPSFIESGFRIGTDFQNSPNPVPCYADASFRISDLGARQRRPVESMTRRSVASFQS
jgi:hypothetical protein